MKLCTSLFIGLCMISAVGGCCCNNACNPCNPCGPCGPTGVQGFGTYGGYGTQWGAISPSTSATYTMPGPIEAPNQGAQPVAAIAPASYTASSAPAYPTIVPAAAPMTALAPVESLPTY